MIVGGEFVKRLVTGVLLFCFLHVGYGARSMGRGSSAAEGYGYYRRRCS